MTFETPLKHITVKTLTGKSFTIDVKANDIVHVVKDKFQKKLVSSPRQSTICRHSLGSDLDWLLITYVVVSRGFHKNSRDLFSALQTENQAGKNGVIA